MMATTTEKASVGLMLLKDAVEEFVRAQPGGTTNKEVAETLGLESDFEGEQKDYLSWSILGLLVNEGRIRHEKRGRGRQYFGA
jgi:uncharacterized protein